MHVIGNINIIIKLEGTIHNIPKSGVALTESLAKLQYRTDDCDPEPACALRER